jgi:hypothetical protein
MSSMVESDAGLDNSVFELGLTREQRKNLALASLGSMWNSMNSWCLGF